MCDRAYLIETSQTVMVIGVLVGAIVFTTLADNYGRKPIFLFSQCAMVVVGVATAFINSYYMFAALRLFAGALQQVGETTHMTTRCLDKRLLAAALYLCSFVNICCYYFTQFIYSKKTLYMFRYLRQWIQVIRRTQRQWRHLVTWLSVYCKI